MSTAPLYSRCPQCGRFVPIFLDDRGLVLLANHRLGCSTDPLNLPLHVPRHRPWCPRSDTWAGEEATALYYDSDPNSPDDPLSPKGA